MRKKESNFQGDKMNSNDFEKVFAKIVDEKITPKLKRLDEKLDATMEMTAKNSEDITLLRSDLLDFKKENSEEHEELSDIVTRTELSTDSIVKRQDEQGDQIIKINKVLKLGTKIS